MTLPQCQLEFHATGDVDDAVLRCELDVLAHWYGDTPQMLDDAYGPYLDQTSFLALRSDDGEVLGTCRMIRPGRHALKTITDIAHEPWLVDGESAARLAGIDVDRAWDVATIGVRHALGSRGRTAAAALYYGLIHSTRANGAEWVVAVLDRRVRSLLATLGLDMHSIPGTAPAPYMGSPACAPVYTHVPTTVDRQRVVAPQAYRLVTLGEGLAGVRLPRDQDLVVDVRSDRPPVAAPPWYIRLPDPDGSPAVSSVPHVTAIPDAEQAARRS